MDTKTIIKEKAREIGFDLVGITDEFPSSHKKEYNEWIKRGFNADMNYLTRTAEVRLSPSIRFNWAKSIIVVGVNYYQGPLPEPQEGEVQISRYAMGRDYHYVIREMLEKLTLFIRSETEIEKVRYYTDTGPILEKELAQKAGLGWVGKNTLLITEEFGSWVFLGELLIDTQLQPDAPGVNGCKDCELCINSCPTKALISPYKLDTNLCSAYHSVENKGRLPEWFPSKNNPYIFGCDICQTICPFNKGVKQTKIDDFIPDERLVNPEIGWLEQLSENEFKELFGNTPVGWAGRDKFMENLRAFKINTATSY